MLYGKSSSTHLAIVYLQIKKQIMNLIRNGALKVGEEMLPEREFSEKLEVSIHFNH